MGSRRSGKARAPPLEPGHSQLHWMRLTSTAEDQTRGVGLADPDDVEARKCAVWSIDEVRRHNSRNDCWMVLRGRVYNVSAYLRYHPGSVEEMMRSAGGRPSGQSAPTRRTAGPLAAGGAARHDLRDGVRALPAVTESTCTPGTDAAPFALTPRRRLHLSL